MQATAIACATEVALASHLAAADLIENEQAHLDVVAEESFDEARLAFREFAATATPGKVAEVISDYSGAIVNDSMRVGGENIDDILAEAFREYAKGERTGNYNGQAAIRAIGQIFSLVANHVAQEAADAAVSAAERGLQ